MEIDDETAAVLLAATDPAELIALTGVAKSVIYRACSTGKVPTRGANGPVIRAALERLALAAPLRPSPPGESPFELPPGEGDDEGADGEGGRGSVIAKRIADTQLAIERCKGVRLANEITAGRLVERDAVAAAHARAGHELRRGVEVLHRSVAAVCPQRARSRVLAEVAAECERMRQAIGDALRIDAAGPR